MDIDIDKLEDIFEKRHGELADEVDASDSEFYVNWCDKHNIIMLHPDWMMETLNEGKTRGRVCIRNPEVDEFANASFWLLVPKKFAMKTLILGYLP